jgi:hypothetical protein
LNELFQTGFSAEKQVLSPLVVDKLVRTDEHQYASQTRAAAIEVLLQLIQGDVPATWSTTI